MPKKPTSILSSPSQPALTPSMLKIHVHPYEMHGFSVVWRCPLTLVLLQLSVSTTFEINSATVHTWSIASNFATASHTGTCAPQPPGLPPMPGASETVHRVCLGSHLNPDPRHRSREQVLPCLGQRSQRGPAWMQLLPSRTCCWTRGRALLSADGGQARRD